jgi:hypothetical protein
LAGVEFRGRDLGRAGELCIGITGFRRRMEGSDVMGPACSRGGECAGSLDGGGLCGAWLGGVELVEIIDGAHGGNVRDRAGVGYAGSRWNRVELGWVAYGAIGLGALKLVVEDLRFGSAGTLMVSLLFYGLILILLPRLTRFGRIEV